ncbi:FG-GAP and VCBS repeat-containing protein [Streptomyces sp. NPDC005480]|uniref:FG-GAP and VCBS repeat-containing protein n=1 Tax=Streptomyces sp. NPDC005480 TaxID=3154880 RepID=UPI0033B2DA00
MRKRTLLLATALTTGLLTLPLTSASAAPSGLQGDFNGDGYRDLAVADPSAAVSGKDVAGAVVVFYGSANGISADRRKVITQATSGIPGTPEMGDAFGESLATADLDRDGYADLLIGDPSEGVGTDRDGGSLTVVWGGASGLGSGTTIQPETVPDEGCTFAEGLATGDTDDNGAPDIVVGSRCSAQYFYGPFTRTGTPAGKDHDHLLGTVHTAAVGNVDGDASAERVMLPGRYSNDPGGRVYLDNWNNDQYTHTELTHADGTVGAIGDTNGDGYGDLVLGDYDDPNTDKPGGHRGGEISVWYGGPSGIDPGQIPTLINQDTTGVPGTGESGDEFGYSIAAADTNKDGYSDVVVGTPGEEINGKGNAGAVTVLLGSAQGLSGTGSLAIHEDTAGVSGVTEGGDAFGYAVGLSDHNADGKADLTVGIADENTTGCTWNTRGTSITGSFYICADKLGFTGGYEGLGSVIAN